MCLCVSVFRNNTKLFFDYYLAASDAHAERTKTPAHPLGGAGGYHSDAIAPDVAAFVVAVQAVVAKPFGGEGDTRAKQQRKSDFRGHLFQNIRKLSGSVLFPVSYYIYV